MIDRQPLLVFNSGTCLPGRIDGDYCPPSNDPKLAVKIGPGFAIAHAVVFLSERIPEPRAKACSISGR